jgi:chromatin segregation and condensation protein Rec8/ScpA/Scc1 (kleisin family)
MAHSLSSASTKQKKKLPRLFDFHDETFESIKEFTSGVTGSVKHDLAEDGAKDMWKQILGKYETASNKAHKLAGDLHEGQEISLSGHGHDAENDPAPKRHDIAPGLEQYNYYREIARSSEKASRVESHQMEQQVEEILVEIKMLMQQSQDLESGLQQLAVEQKPAEVGKYHVHFFDWVLATIRTARMKVEDSGAWLSAMSGKKGKKTYWSEFKKHGTSFGMSNERSVATQTG